MVVLEQGYVVKFFTQNKKYVYLERSKIGAINAMMECCDNVLDIEYGQHAYIECFDWGKSIYKEFFIPFLHVEISQHMLTFQPKNEFEKLTFWDVYFDGKKIEYDDEEILLEDQICNLIGEKYELRDLEKLLIKGIFFPPEFLMDIPDIFVYDEFPMVIDERYFSSDDEEDENEYDVFQYIEGLNKL